MADREPEPTWELLRELVAGLDYRPGWSSTLVEVEHGESKGLRFDIYAVGYDSYHPDRGQTYRVRHSFIVPPASYNETSWGRWLLERFLDVERHEAMEFFRVAGRRPFAPNHGPGHDPYHLRELNTVEAAETTFRGVRREGTQA